MTHDSQKIVFGPDAIEAKLTEIKHRLNAIDAKKRIKPAIFLGPSLKKKAATYILDAEYHPPIKRGDLEKVVEKGHRLIGIIDGYFHQNLSVSMSEIHEAISEGVHVYGSSSIGALRAAEAHNIGMIGVGKIFSWYLNGKVEAEDEIAMAFEEESYRAFSVPLVNIRSHLEEASQKKIINIKTRKTILNIAAKLHFSERSYPNICRHLEDHLSPKDLRDIRKEFSRQLTSQKAQDALLLLRRMKEDYDSLRAFQNVSR